MRPLATSLLLLLLSLTGCNRSLAPDLKDDVIAVTILNDQIYEYRTGIGGDEEYVTISVQAKHFEISEIVRSSETGWEAVYRYKAMIGFRGADYVEIETRTGSDGASPPTSINTLKISITIK